MGIRGDPASSEGNLSAAGGVALQCNQGCSDIGKHFKKEINGASTSISFVTISTAQARQSCFASHIFRWKHVFQLHLFSRHFRWCKVPRASLSLLPWAGSSLLSSASSQSFLRSLEFPSTVRIYADKIFSCARIVRPEKVPRHN